MSKMLTFQGFDNREAADQLAGTLQQHGLEVFVEQNPSLLDSNIIGQDFGNQVLVKLWPADFELAKQILIDTTVIDIDEVDKDYMLFRMTDKELEAVVAAPEEWGVWNYKLALQILESRGIPVTAQDTVILQANHISGLAEQQPLSTGMKLSGYGFSLLTLLAALTINPVMAHLLFSFSALPGLLGIIIGITIIRSRKTLPDGRQIASYDNNARMHGRWMIAFCILSIACMIILLGLAAG